MKTEITYEDMVQAWNEFVDVATKFVDVTTEFIDNLEIVFTTFIRKTKYIFRKLFKQLDIDSIDELADYSHLAETADELIESLKYLTPDERFTEELKIDNDLALQNNVDKDGNPLKNRYMGD